MAALSFFQNRQTQPKVAHFNHGDQTSLEAKDFLVDYCARYKIELVVADIAAEPKPSESLEAFWRTQRYGFLHSLPLPVISAHTLDDNIESWIYNSLHGKPHCIPYQNKNVIRPFALTPKANLKRWCEEKKVPWYEDSINTDTKFQRAYIRHQLMPHALRVNPGLAKVVAKIVEREYRAHIETVL